MLTGVFIGTVGVMMLNGETVASPFTSILEALMDEGGFAKAIGVIAATASLAAISEFIIIHIRFVRVPIANLMNLIIISRSVDNYAVSMADSLVIAISQLVMVEIVYPLRPSTTPKEIAWIGCAVSLIGATLALLIGYVFYCITCAKAHCQNLTSFFPCCSIFWKEGIADMGAIQFPLSMQAVPGM